jgi:hypothetical protein
MDAIWPVVAFLFLTGLAIFGLIGQRPVNKIVAYLALNPEAMKKVHRAIEDAFHNHDFGDHPDEFIEDETVERTKHIVCESFAGIYRGQPFEVVSKKRFDSTPEWPKVKAIVDGELVIIRVNLGASLMGHRAEMKPVKTHIRRNTVIKLDTRRPIAEALAEIQEPPPKQAVNAKPTPASPVKPMPAAPRRRTLNDKA